MLKPARPATLGELFRGSASRAPRAAAFLHKADGRYVRTTWSQAVRIVDALSSELVSLGLKPGQRLAILSENRPEWAYVDLACQTIGVATVPIYTSLTSSEIQYLLTDSAATALVVSSKALFEKVPPIQRALTQLKIVIGLDAVLEAHRAALMLPVKLWKELDLDRGLSSEAEAFSKRVAADDLCSLIYTSGTTGVPKGVMLTHRNFIENAALSQAAFKIRPTDRHLSFLPLSHVFERLGGYYLMINAGAQIAYAENMDTVPQNLLEVRPTFLLGVPRFYEKTRDRVLEVVEHASSLKKGMFHWARDLGAKKRLGKPLGIFYGLQHALATALVYDKFRKRLGGRLRLCISGGAPLPAEVGEFFCDLGIMIYEGYGLTETSPVISVNRQDRWKFGTVGIPLEGLNLRLSQEGEIQTSSVCVMKGYLNKPAETDAVLKDGWFSTGDLGVIDKDGFLKITGRKKELIVTSGGKKIAPRAIEEILERDPAILRAILFGEGKKFITALVVPRPEVVQAQAKSAKLTDLGYTELLKNPQIYAWMEAKVIEATRDLANFEKIKYFALLDRDLTQEAGELTPTLKVKREAVWSHHKDLLLPFYDRP